MLLIGYIGGPHKDSQWSIAAGQDNNLGLQPLNFSSAPTIYSYY
jgi:hypothetical protein